MRIYTILIAFMMLTLLYITFLAGRTDGKEEGLVQYIFSKNVGFSPANCSDHEFDRKKYFVALDDQNKIGVTSNGLSIATCKDFFALFEREVPQPLTAPGKGD